MNYYERHLGDYAKDTAHLSMIEHGAYTLLMDRYYSTEKPIPEDQAYRVTRARSKEEKQAVDAVLGEFFTLTDGSHTKGRIDEEIAKVQTKIKAAQENGKKGGRPKGNPKTTQEKPSGLFLGSEIETGLKAHQSPVTSHQSSKELIPSLTNPQEGGADDAEIPKTTTAGEICKALKAAGLQSVSPNHPELLALIAKGVTREQFIEAAQAASGKRSPFAYMLSVVKSQLAAANDIEKSLGMPDTAWDLNGSTIRTKAAELGFPAWEGDNPSGTKQPELFSAYTARLREFIESKKGQS